MKKSSLFLLVAAAGFFLGRASLQAQKQPRVYELRTYTTNEGKLPDLNKRFREHTMEIFERHGMKNVVYLVPMDAPQSSNTLTYLVSHESREAADKNWREFGADPEWIKVRNASEENGKIVTNVARQYLVPTDYSPMK